MMRILLILLVFSSSSFQIWAQSQPQLTTYSKLLANSLLKYRLELEKPATDLILPPSFTSKYQIYKSPKGYYISALMLATHPNDSQLRALDIHIQSRVGEILTAQILLKSIFQLHTLSGIQVIDFGKRVNKKLDKARLTVKADKVQSGVSPLNKAYLGSNVIIGVIDYGFDFTHPMFDDGNNLPRILSCWNQNGSGKTPAGFNYGDEISTPIDLLDAISSSSDESHGTHVLGIAAGSGIGSNNLYIGMAPAAKPVLVDLRNTDADIIDGINYIFNQASKLKMPAVINMSLGQHIGPHDGTSLVDQAIDKLSGKGRIICGASGNEADLHIHLSHQFISDSVKTFILFEDNYNQTGSGIVDIWGDENKSFSAVIAWYDENTRKEIYRTRVYHSDHNSSGDTMIIIGGDSLNIRWAEVKKYIGNNKANIQFDIENLSSHYTAIIISKADGYIHMWNDGQGNGADFSNKIGTGKMSGFTDGNSDYSCGEIGGTARNIISVGAFTDKVNYTNLKKNVIDISSSATMGNLAAYSSKGPTADGRTKPDITAPGQMVVSAVSSDDLNFDATTDESVYKTTFGGYDYFYAAFEGTSMATPCVAGIVALMLEANTNLDPSAIKNILAMTAITDSYTGTIGAAGTNNWGYGKINAFDAVNASTRFNGALSGESLNNRLYIFPNPANQYILISFENKNIQNTHIKVFSADGKEIVNENISIINGMGYLSVEKLSSGIYYIICTTENQALSSQKLIIEN